MGLLSKCNVAFFEQTSSWLRTLNLGMETFYVCREGVRREVFFFQHAVAFALHLGCELLVASDCVGEQVTACRSRTSNCG
ncbi:hypothetical protein Pla52o_12960 [Novipirellula galeiformis]|uniref:Uncharacterized protein n=1 Tax=Novipirellula galeiformis TaxID=2528004 RepID=A0A5C6CQB4_9BACT|nr:hypothetical protein Pla52o_12960 [Novipirellula galeiformis]